MIRAGRIALFSHDSQGLGHVRRNIEVAAALTRAGAATETLLISGAPRAASLPLPERTRMLTIPSVCKDRDGTYLSADTSRTLAETLTERGRATATALREFAPDLVIVDKHARGLHGELDPALEDLQRLRAEGGGPAMVLGLRDVLDDPRTARREWVRDGTTEAVLTHYDEIWVYGDRSVHDPVRSYALGPEIGRRVRCTGYLSRGRGVGLRAAHTERVPNQPYVLGMLGGGQDGADLALALAEAPSPPGHVSVLITGPYLDPAVLRRLERRAATRSDLRVLPFVASTQPWVRHASAVVSMGGYNTVCEVLATGAPVLVVPRIQPRLEQAVRADLLATSTHLEWLHPRLARPAALGDWMASAVRRRPAPHPIDLDGLDRLPRLARALLDTRSRSEVAHAHA